MEVNLFWNLLLAIDKRLIRTPHKFTQTCTSLQSTLAVEFRTYEIYSYWRNTMPLYEYHCTHCGEQTELLQKMSDEPAKKCPHCSTDNLIKQISAAGFQLKGNGWYVTDFRDKKPAATTAKTEAPAEKTAEKSVEKQD